MIIDKFIITLKENGLDPDVIIPDGEIHRFKTTGKDLSGWYVCFQDTDSIGGSYGDWRTGLSETYSEFGEKITPSEKKNLLVKIQAAKEKASIERKKLNKKAAEKAVWIWDNSETVLEHDYLKNKKVKNHGLKMYKSSLVIPITSSDKKIKSLQFIDPEGKKKFLGNSVIDGNAFKIPGNIDKIFICEGYSTGATIAEITKNLVVCAFNSGNLPAVSKKIREAFPLNKIIIAADNDKFNKVNVGILKAEQSANSINATMIYPKFSDDSKKFTDFNDLFVSEGSKVTLEQLNEIKSGLFDEVKKFVQSTKGTIKLIELNNHFNFREKSEKNTMLSIVELMCEKNILKKDKNSSFLYKVISDEEDIFKLEEKVVFYKACLPFSLEKYVNIPEKSIIIIAGETNGGKTACLLDCLNKNILSITAKKMTYFSSEMGTSELLNRLDLINPNRAHWEIVDFINRAEDFEDLIVGDRKDGINFIDFLEPVGPGGYTEFEQNITSIRDSLNKGIAFINLQKTTGKEFARGGEGTNSKARLSINLSKCYRSESGGYVNVCEIKKNKINKKEMIDVDGRKCFYIASGSGITTLSEWQYVSPTNEKYYMEELKQTFPEAESTNDTLRLIGSEN